MQAARLVNLMVALAFALAGVGSGCGTGDGKPPQAGSAAAAAPDGQSSPTLYPIKQGGRWGFIDGAGHVVVEPQYEHATRYSNGRALAWKDRKCLLLGPAGRPVAESPFTHDHQPFYEGFAWGSIGLEFRFIDLEGRLLPGVFAGAQHFSEGLAAVCVNPARFDRSRRESDPYPLGKWGFIDTRGQLVIAADYYHVGPFSHGLAPVYVGGRPAGHGAATGGKWGYIDRRGRLVIDPAFESAAPFSEGLAAVGVGGNRYGYIDAAGTFVINPRPFMMAGPFREGLAAIRGGEVRGGVYFKGFGYMDKTGRVVIPEELGYATDFCNGLAAARLSPSVGERQWGYVDRAGRWVVKPQFDHALPFHSELAMVDRDGMIAYIDRSGQFVWRLTK